MVVFGIRTDELMNCKNYNLAECSGRIRYLPCFAVAEYIIEIKRSGRDEKYSQDIGLLVFGEAKLILITFLALRFVQL
jgi:hypothetical protein